MSVGSQVALWFAALFGAGAVLLLIVLAARRLLSGAVVRRLQVRVGRVEQILQEHRGDKFQRMERLLFQLAEIQDREAVETALSVELEAQNQAFREQYQRLFETLGLVDRYMTELRGGEKWTQRAAAARALGQLGHYPAIPLLVEAMRDANEDGKSVKVAAAQALGQMRAVEAVPLLLAELKLVDEWASPRIAEVLITFGKDAVPKLIASLGDESNANIRVWAAQILGRLEDPTAVTPLLARLGDRSEQVRMSVCEALGRIGDRRAVNDLVKLARRDPVAPVRAEAARALGSLGDETVVQSLVTLLSDADYWTRLRAIEAIELIRPEDTTALDAALRDPSAEVRGRAAVALERIGVLDQRVDELASSDRGAVDRAHRTLVEMGKAGLIESILSYLEHESFKVRARIVLVLGEVGDAYAVPTIVPLLEEPMWPVRARAVEAIGRLRPDDGVQLLLPALSDPEETVRAAAISAIRGLGAPDDEEGIEALIALFDGANAEVRRGVLEAVNRLNVDAINELLRRALLDPNATVRLQAVDAVAQRASSEWLEALEACLADPDNEVRIKAAHGLGQIGTEAAIDTVAHNLTTGDRKLREELASVLATQGVEAIEALFADARTLEERLAVVWALGKTEDPAAMPLLESTVSAEEHELRAAVAGAAAKIRDGRSVELAHGLLGDRNERVRAAAANALGVLGDTRAIDWLEGAFSDPDPFVRNRVVLALGRIGDERCVDALIRARLSSTDPSQDPFIVISLALTGSEEGFNEALAALALPQLRSRVDAVLRRQDPEVQAQFRRNLHLDGGGEDVDEGLSEDELGERYADSIRSSQDPVRRRHAVQALAALGSAPYRALLINTVRTDPDPGVRIQALVALEGQSRDTDVLRALSDGLRDPSVEVQRQAARSFLSVGDPKFNALLLKSFLVGDADLDDAIVAALVRANGGAGVMEFVDLLMGYREEAVLRGGARVLGEVADPRATRLLSQWLHAKPVPLRAAALEGLGQIGTVEARDAIIAAKSDPVEDVRLAAVAALGRMGGGDALKALEPLCRDPSTRVRMSIAELIGLSRSAASIELAEHLSEDPELEVRRAAMLGLLVIGDGRAAARFVELFASQPEESQSFFRQVSWEHPAVERARALVTEDKSPEARAVAIHALRLLGDRPTDLLLTAMKDPAPDVRIQAIESAVGIDDDQVREALEALLRDPDKSVRDAVRKGRMTLLG